MENFDYKIKRDNLGDAYTKSKTAMVLSCISIAIAVLGLTTKLILFLLQGE